MYCKKCGNEIEKGYAFCDKCGTKVEESELKTSKKKQDVVTEEVYRPQPQYYMYSKPNEGSSISTAAMVIGIIVAFVLTFELTGFIVIDSIYGIRGYEVKYAYYVALIFELIPFILSIVGLVLSIVGVAKYKNGKSVTGLILSIVAIIEAIILLVLLVNIVD